MRRQGHGEGLRVARGEHDGRILLDVVRLSSHCGGASFFVGSLCRVVPVAEERVRVCLDEPDGITIAGLARDVAVGDLDGVPGDEILIISEKSEIVSLRGVAW